MHHFAYRDGRLHCEGVDLATIADAVGTPAYVYSTATLVRHLSVLQDAFAGQNSLIAYSVKANSNLGVLKTLGAEGAGADVVSEGELRRALVAGIPPDRIVFSGVGKSHGEIDFALDAGIHQFNVESLPEMERLARLARARGAQAPMAYRVNPHVAAGGHANISTGKAEDKFGIAWHEAEAAYDAARDAGGLDVCGVDVHIGSQITEIGPMREAFEKVVGLVHRLRERGHHITRIDLGGGLGIPYEPGDSPDPPHAYAAMVADVLSGLDCQVILEPGRMIAGNAGVLLSRVEYVKHRDGRTFLILDTGMNDLMRPALYQAHHEILPLREPTPDAERSPVDVVGPICESTDRFALQRPLPVLAEGDLVAFMSAGAYGAVMSNQYNTRQLCAEVLVRDTDFAVVRQRPTFEDMLAIEKAPDWLT